MFFSVDEVSKVDTDVVFQKQKKKNDCSCGSHDFLHYTFLASGHIQL